jgi:hypothetical protein
MQDHDEQSLDPAAAREQRRQLQHEQHQLRAQRLEQQHARQPGFQRGHAFTLDARKPERGHALPLDAGKQRQCDASLGLAAGHSTHARHSRCARG